MIEPVGESLLRQVVNPIPESHEYYIRRLYPLEGGNLTYEYTVLSPVVNLTLSTKNETGIESLTHPATISLSASIPNVLDRLTDTCLAKLNSTLSTWVCISRGYSLGKDNLVDFYIDEIGGTLAVILNLDPQVYSQAECGWVC